jgi:methionyl-tRNA formyltransferase
MKVLFVTGSVTSIPLLQWLMQQQLLCGLLVQEELNLAMPSIGQSIQQMRLPFLSLKREQLQQPTTKTWLESLNANMALVFGFSWIVPKQLLAITTNGWFNIHFSKLPAYKGPAPVFWQIKQGEAETAITIHKMIAKADEGEIVMQQVFPIPKHVTNSSFNWMLANLTPALADIFFREQLYLLKNKAHTNNTIVTSYHARPTLKDYTICWAKQTAFEIENLVNATNPVYGGAICYYKQQEIRIIQATEVANSTPSAKPGLISNINSTEELLVVAAKETCLAVQVVSTAMGILTAKRFISLLNIQPNDFFN